MPTAMYHTEPSARRPLRGQHKIVGRPYLFKYVLRPPIAQEHVSFTDDGLVSIQLKKPFRDGTVSVEMDPLSLVSRLPASVHPPRFDCVRSLPALPAA